MVETEEGIDKADKEATGEDQARNKGLEDANGEHNFWAQKGKLGHGYLLIKERMGIVYH